MTQPVEPQSLYQLSPLQIAAILKAAGREGWNTAGNVVAETELKTDPLRGTTSPVPTGKYTLSITDNQGNSQEIELAKGGPSYIQEAGQIGPPVLQNESWIVQKAPSALPKSTTSTETMKGPNDTIYEKVNGVWTPVVPGDETRAAAGRLELAGTQAKYDEMMANVAAGRGFISNKDAADLQLALQRGELDRETLNFRRDELARKNALEWETERRLGRTAEVEQGLTRARTGQVGVETALNEERLNQLIKAGPEAQRQAVLANEVTETQLEAARQKLRQPTIQDLGQGPTYAMMSPEGRITEQMRQGYVPKTQAEIAARVGQIQAAANAKQQEVLEKYRDNPEQGLQEFNRWYDQNVESQVGALQAAQEEAQFARAKEQASTRTAAYTAAQQAGQLALDAYKAQAPRRVGPGAAQMFGGALNAINRAAKLPEQDYSALITKSPNIMRETPEQAATRVLSAISPTAAQMAGAQQPNYAAMNPAEALNRTRWGLGGAPAAAAPAAAATAAAPATPGGWPPGATTPIIVNEAGEQQWGYPMQTGAAPAMDTTGFGGAIGNDPMAAALQAAQVQPEAAPPAAVAAAPPAPAGPRIQRRMPAPVAAAAPAPTGGAYYPTEVGGPVYEPPPYAPSVSAFGEPMYPTEVGGPMSYGTPGFGFDPSNIQVAPAAPPVQYMPSQYQFPGMQGILDAARAAYQAVPRVRFGPGGWR